MTKGKKSQINEKYIEELRMAIRKKDKIRRALNKEDELITFLISIGMNPEWSNNAAAIGIIRNRLANILKEGKQVRIKDGLLLFNKGNRFGVTEDSQGKFLLENSGEYLCDVTPGDDEQVTGDGFIKYEYEKASGNLQKRIISPDGVVIYSEKRYGVLSDVEGPDNWIQLIRLSRDPDSPHITRTEIYRTSIDSPTERTVKEYDYGYPITLDKNGTTHEKTPFYFVKRYPQYEQWFAERYGKYENYARNAFNIQDQALLHVLDKHVHSLAQTMEEVIAQREKLNLIYTEIIKAFGRSKGGALYRMMFLSSLNKIFDDNSMHFFYDDDTKESIRESMLERLSNEPVNEDELAERLEREKKKIVGAVQNSDQIQQIQTVFKERPSVTDEDYSLEDALKDVDKRSRMIEHFDQNDENPFVTEQERLSERISYYKLQQRILVTANSLVPFAGKKVKKQVERKIDDNPRKKIRRKDIFDQDIML